MSEEPDYDPPGGYYPDAPEGWRQWWWNVGSSGVWLAPRPGEDEVERIRRLTLEVWSEAERKREGFVSAELVADSPEDMVHHLKTLAAMIDESPAAPGWSVSDENGSSMCNNEGS